MTATQPPTTTVADSTTRSTVVRLTADFSNTVNFSVSEQGAQGSGQLTSTSSAVGTPLDITMISTGNNHTTARATFSNVYPAASTTVPSSSETAGYNPSVGKGILSNGVIIEIAVISAIVASLVTALLFYYCTKRKLRRGAHVLTDGTVGRSHFYTCKVSPWHTASLY